MKKELRLAMLVSGGGTTMQVIIQACQAGQLTQIKPVLVIASRIDAGAIQKALALGISEQDVRVLERKSYSDSESFGKAILHECKSRRVDLIGQYGWMVMTPANVVEQYIDMMINQHPGPLDPCRPDFGGKGMFSLRVHAAVLYFSRKVGRLWTEATAQRVALDYDQGMVLNRTAIPILNSDDPFSLAKRLLPIEHNVQIRTLQDFANDRVKEIARNEPLVFTHEIPILEEAKQLGTILFPHG